MGETPTIN